MTVSTWAMDSLTTLIFESLLGAPPVTLATLKRANSAFNSFNYIVSKSICKLSRPKRGQQSHHSSLHMVKDNRQIRRDQACPATTMQYQAQIKTSRDSGKIADLIKEFGLALRPQLVNLDLSHDEELLQLTRWRDNSAGSKSRQERRITLLSKISSRAA
jgi:hypothetical protein